MPQVKELKELKLPVGNEEEKGRYGGALDCNFTAAVSAVFMHFAT